jgi:hypothetical protein
MQNNTRRSRRLQRSQATFRSIGEIIGALPLWRRELEAGKRTMGTADALHRAACWEAAGRNDNARETIEHAPRVEVLLASLARPDGSLSLAAVLDAGARERLDVAHGGEELAYALLRYVRNGDTLRTRATARVSGAA